MIRVARPRRQLLNRSHRGAARPPPLTPVSSMRGFWGLMRAYWFSDRWKEAWGLTLVIAFFTAASSKTSVWMAEASGELVNSIAFFHDPGNATPLASCLPVRACWSFSFSSRMPAFVGVRHLFSTTLHRKWRGWLDGRFNEALLDSNHTHFHLQHGARDDSGAAASCPRQYRPARPGIDQGHDRRRHRPRHGRHGRRHVALLRRPETDRDVDGGQRAGVSRRLWQRRPRLRGGRRSMCR